MTPGSFRRWVCAVTASSLTVVALPAFADEAPAAPDWHRDPRAVGTSERVAVRNWYGWQILVTDSASVAVFTAGASASRTSLLVLGLAGYLAAAPIVHLAHGRPGAAVGSLAIRVLLPILGVAAGAAIDGGQCRELCIPLGAVVGFGLGAVVASAIDIVLLANELGDEQR